MDGTWGLELKIEKKDVHTRINFGVQAHGESGRPPTRRSISKERRSEKIDQSRGGGRELNNGGESS